jgi:membrane-associated protease RseP (regulator of RpoE activity)
MAHYHLGHSTHGMGRTTYAEVLGMGVAMRTAATDEEWARLRTPPLDRRLEVGWVAGSAFLAAVVALGVLSPPGLAVLVGLTVLVLIHEGAHLVAARRCEIEVTEFFAGFGPVVVAWRTPTGLRVGLKAIPAGGYVKVIGMSSREVVDPAAEPRTFRAATRGQRLAVVLAGPAVNIAFGLLLLVGAALVEGRVSVLQAITGSWHWLTDIALGTLHGIGAIASDPVGYGAAVADPARAGDAPSRFLSPVGVAQVSTDLAALGPGPLIRLMAVASIGLGVMNALPLPPLDGGHAAVIGVEGAVARLTHRPRFRLDTSNRIVAAVTTVTFVLVIALGASAVIMDVGSPVGL